MYADNLTNQLVRHGLPCFSSNETHYEEKSSIITVTHVQSELSTLLFQYSNSDPGGAPTICAYIRKTLYNLLKTILQAV